MHTEKTTLQIVLADDHAVARAGIGEMVEAAPDMNVVGEAVDGDQALALVTELRPDVALLDLEMPGCSVFEIAEWVKLNSPETVVLLLSGHQTDKSLAQAIRRGIRGYLSKDRGFRYLLDAIRRAVGGEWMYTEEQYSRAVRWECEVGRVWEAPSFYAPVSTIQPLLCHYLSLA